MIIDGAVSADTPLTPPCVDARNTLRIAAVCNRSWIRKSNREGERGSYPRAELVAARSQLARLLHRAFLHGAIGTNYRANFQLEIQTGTHWLRLPNPDRRLGS